MRTRARHIVKRSWNIKFLKVAVAQQEQILFILSYNFTSIYTHKYEFWCNDNDECKIKQLKKH